MKSIIKSFLKINIMLLLVLSMLSQNVSFAWLPTVIKEVNMNSTGGQLLTQYFHCGTGSVDDPFVITRPIHYFNLVNLYQRVEGYSDEDYYFQIGYNKLYPGQDGDNYLVYAYDDNGAIEKDAEGNDKYSKTLNLNFYDGSDADHTLLPIGTHDKNFLGHFDGKGLEIDGVTISGANSTNGICDIGIFGYVGEGASIKNVYFDNVTIDLTNATNVVSSVTGAQTHNEDAHFFEGDDVSYAGYLVGHIVKASVVEDVYLNNMTMVGGKAAANNDGYTTNNYGYFGCVEEGDGVLSETLGEAIGTQFAAGDNAGWGNTVDMKNMFKRLTAVVKKAASVAYPSEETVVMKDGKMIMRRTDKTSSTTASHSGYSLTFKHYGNTEAGSYYFNTANGTNPWIYLTGENQYQQKTVHVYTATESDKNAYYVFDFDGRNYLSVSSDNKVTNATDEDNASIWLFEVAEADKSDKYTLGYMYTYVVNTKYYLNANGNTMSLSTTKSTKWKLFTDDKGYQQLKTDGNYYLMFKNTWQLTNENVYVGITDGNNNYIGVTDGNIVNVNSNGAAAGWEKTEYNSGSQVSFKTIVGTATKYLGIESGNGIVLLDSEFKWNSAAGSSSGYYSYSYTLGGTTWYLAFDDGWKAVTLSGTCISIADSTVSPAATRYLAVNKTCTDITNSSRVEYSSLWQLDTSASETQITMKYNGSTYYLGADFLNDELVLSTNPVASSTNFITWKKGTNNYYIENAGWKYYLVYRNGWRIESNQKCKIYLGSHHLGFSYANVDAGYIADYATYNGTYCAWTFEDKENVGKASVRVDGTDYYLCAAASNTLVFRCEETGTEDNPGWKKEQATDWKKDSVGIYTLVNGINHYICYDGTWKLSMSDYTIACENGMLLGFANENNTITSVSEASDTVKTGWRFEDDYCWIEKGDTSYYLTASAIKNSRVTLTNTATTKWKYTGTSIYTQFGDENSTKYYLQNDGQNWYIDTADGYPLIVINSGSNYLALNTSNTNNITNYQYANHYAHWRYDSSSHLVMDYNNSVYYLVGKTDGSLGVVNNSANATVWQKDTTNNDYYFVNKGEKYYIGYENGWKVYKEARTIFSCTQAGTTYYMGISETSGGEPNGIISTTAESAAGWTLTSVSGGTTIRLNRTDYPYYLGWNSSTNTLTLSSTTTTWKYDSTNGYYTSDGIYLTYDDTNGRGWCCKALSGYYAIKDGAGTNYLDVNPSTGSIRNKTTTNTTKWEFSNTARTADAKTTISTVIGNTKKYLGYSGTSLALTTSSCQWTYDADQGTYYCDISGVKYYLMYDPGWVNGTAGWIIVPQRYLISNADATIYIAVDCSGVESKAKAAQWTASGTGPSGEFTTKEGYKLGYKFTHAGHYPSKADVVGDLATRKFDIQISNPPVTVGDFTYSSVGFSGKVLSVKEEDYRYFWKVKDWKGTWCYIGELDSTGYLYYNNNKWTIEIVADVNPNRTAVVFTSVLQSTSITATTYAGSTKNTTDFSGKYANSSSWSMKTLTKEGTRSSNVAFSTTTGETIQALSFVSKTVEKVPCETLVDKPKNHTIKTGITKALDYDGPIDHTEQNSGYATYFPIRLALQNDDDSESYYSDFRVSSKNTGYIVSGANQTQGGYRADIRVSEYDTSDIGRALNTNGTPTYSSSYDSKLQVITCTASSNAKYGSSTNYGYVRIQDSRNSANINSYNSNLPSNYMTWQDLKLTKYQAEYVNGVETTPLTRAAFANMLMGDNALYGLHFMESTIPNFVETDENPISDEINSRIIRADQATILGKTYDYYELPEDAIDFKVVERGAINFFAGTYYSSSVTSFFSLHHIERDSKQHITAIREIKQVYQKDNENYVYKYKDGSYSNPHVTDAIIKSNYSLVFDLNWITNPNSIIQNALYYFEIPVNRGEYALGSVDGGIGAYLLYLDIAIRGGGATESRISTEGIGSTNGFDVEYRSYGDEKMKDETRIHSLLQFAVDFPNVVDTSKFSIKTVFIRDDQADTEDDHPMGLYDITVKNYTGSNVDLTVFVCDNDEDSSNDYPYAYRITYYNSDGSGVISDDGQTYFKSCYIHEIPAYDD